MIKKTAAMAAVFLFASSTNAPVSTISTFKFISIIDCFIIMIC